MMNPVAAGADDDGGPSPEDASGGEASIVDPERALRGCDRPDEGVDTVDPFATVAGEPAAWNERIGFCSGDLVDEFTVLEERLGAGTYGEVWRTGHPTLGPRAIKILKGASEPEKRAKLMAEAGRLATLARRRLTVQVHRTGQIDGRDFLEMELAEGESLEDRLQRAGPFDRPWPLALRARRRPALGSTERTGFDRRWLVSFVTKLCGIMTEVHALSIIHRDLKPANLFVLEEGGRLTRVTVLDFGLAKHFGDSGALPSGTIPGTPLGTPAYISPEQARGEVELDPRSDLYAIGVILYELLTGVRPFDARTNAALCLLHVGEPPPPFRLRSPTCRAPGSVERVVLKCLAKDPKDRPRNAAALARAFRWAWWEGPIRRLLLAVGLLLAGCLVRAAVRGTSPTSSASAVPTAELVEQPPEAASDAVIEFKAAGDPIEMSLARVPPANLGAPAIRMLHLSPAHEVERRVGRLFMATTETTERAYRAVMGLEPADPASAELPVTGVSWDEAHAYCEILGRLLGENWKVRMPYEHEWEYVVTLGREFADVDLGGVRLGEPARATPYPVVASGVPNDWGVADLVGNVSEWMEDAYEAPSIAELHAEANEMADYPEHVVRGGSLRDARSLATLEERYGESNDAGGPFRGFRVVVERISNRSEQD